MVLITSRDIENDRHKIFNSLFSLIDFRLMSDSFKGFFYSLLLLHSLCSLLNTNHSKWMISGGPLQIRNLALLICILAHYVCSNFNGKIRCRRQKIPQMDYHSNTKYIGSRKVNEKNNKNGFWRIICNFGIRSKKFFFIIFVVGIQCVTHMATANIWLETAKSKGFEWGFMCVCWSIFAYIL